MTKYYIEEMKYEGRTNNLHHKLFIFYEMCGRFDIPHEAKANTFFIMFKEMTLNYYHANMNKSETFITFVGIYENMKNYFKNAEHKKIILLT